MANLELLSDLIKLRQTEKALAATVCRPVVDWLEARQMAVDVSRLAERTLAACEAALEGQGTAEAADPVYRAGIMAYMGVAGSSESVGACFCGNRAHGDVDGPSPDCPQHGVLTAGQ